MKNNFSLVILVIGSLFLWFHYTFIVSPQNQQNQPNQTNQSYYHNENLVHTESEQSLTIGGWIPAWASQGGFSVFEKNIQLFDNISPVWYEVLPDGNLKETKPVNSREIVKLARQNKIKVVPSIAMFDHEIFTQILQNETNLDRHIKTIVQTVVDNQYDGIDIDYESTKLSDKEKYFEFLERLSSKLKSEEKILAVSVLAKWGDDVRYSYLPQTRQVQDWSRIAQYADEIRIMTYDYTPASALYPGPIAPIDWVEEVVDYALTKTEANKFVLGIHLYSYERWVEVPNPSLDKGFDHPSLQFKNSFRENSTSQTQARSYTFDIVEQLLEQNQGQIEEYRGEKIFRYRKVNPVTGVLENRILVYIDSQGVSDRLELAKQKGLKGVVFWQLSGSDGILSKLDT